MRATPRYWNLIAIWMGWRALCPNRRESLAKPRSFMVRHLGMNRKSGAHSRSDPLVFMPMGDKNILFRFRDVVNDNGFSEAEATQTNADSEIAVVLAALDPIDRNPWLQYRPSNKQEAVQLRIC
jgi:hypothetical protein